MGLFAKSVLFRDSASLSGHGQILQDEAEKKVIASRDEVPSQVGQAIGAEGSLPCIPLEPGVFLRGGTEDRAAGCPAEDTDTEGDACRVGTGMAELTVFPAFEDAFGDRMHAKTAANSVMLFFVLSPGIFFFEDS